MTLLKSTLPKKFQHNSKMYLKSERDKISTIDFSLLISMCELRYKDGEQQHILMSKTGLLMDTNRVIMRESMKLPIGH